MVRVTPTDDAGLTNTATVSSSTFDPGPSNNSSTTVTDVAPAADLSIQGEARPEVRQGSKFAYALAVTNSGPDDTQNATVTQHMPRGVKVGRKGIDERCSYDQESRMMTCKIEELPSAEGANETAFEIPVKARRPGGKTAVAAVTSETYDPNVANESVEMTTKVREKK